MIHFWCLFLCKTVFLNLLEWGVGQDSCLIWAQSALLYCFCEVFMDLSFLGFPCCVPIFSWFFSFLSFYCSCPTQFGFHFRSPCPARESVLVVLRVLKAHTSTASSDCATDPLHLLPQFPSFQIRWLHFLLRSCRQCRSPPVYRHVRCPVASLCYLSHRYWPSGPWGYL